MTMTHRASGLAALVMLAFLAASGDATGADTTAGEPAPDAAASSYTLPAEVLDTTWQWIWYGDGKEQFDVDKPEQYTVQFSSDGTVAIQADCNRGTATFTLGPDRQITLSPVATTLMLCPEGSLDGRFVGTLDRVRTYFEMEGDFFLEVPLDSGTLRFRRKAD
jgi:heat shock protein HslJ